MGHQTEVQTAESTAWGLGVFAITFFLSLFVLGILRIPYFPILASILGVIAGVKTFQHKQSKLQYVVR